MRDSTHTTQTVVAQHEFLLIPVHFVSPLRMINAVTSGSTGARTAIELRPHATTLGD